MIVFQHNHIKEKLGLVVRSSQIRLKPFSPKLANTVELQWLEHVWNHEIMFEAGVVPDNEC